MQHLLRAFRASVAVKISAVIVTLAFLVMSIVGVVNYSLYREHSLQLNGERALAIAQSVAAMIDGDTFADSLRTLERDEQWPMVKKAADDIVSVTGVTYLYILGSEMTDTATYYLEGIAGGYSEDEMTLGDLEEVSFYPEEMPSSIKAGQAGISDIYDAMEFGVMLTAYTPIWDSAGAVRGVVCVDVILEDVMEDVNAFGLQTLLSSLVASCLFALASVLLVRLYVGKPIAKLTQASDQLAMGNTNVQLDIRSQDEIGRLAQSFRRISDSGREQAETLDALANGDLTVRAKPRSQMDTTGNAINSLAEQLNDMVGEISDSAGQVSAASGAIAHGAQALSAGASEQNATIAELAESIRQITEQVAENSARVEQAVALSREVIDQAGTGYTQMSAMISAVQEIEQANREIDNVMRIIDEIARQTNLLALNASIEASHAGMHGAGFAVVAEEVRRLAARSAESAQQTADMIESSIMKTALGVRIAQETAQSMEKIIQGVRDSNEIISGIAESSQRQSRAIASISRNVENVSTVVRQNSVTAQESAAASEEMNGQADALSGLMTRFHL